MAADNNTWEVDRVMLQTFTKRKRSSNKRVAKMEKLRELPIQTLGRLSVDGIASQYRSQQGECYYCERPLSPTTLSIDHYRPLGAGGLNQDDNIVLSCHTCNNTKDNDWN